VSENSARRRVFGTLDGIRGVAAILVLMRHVPYFGHLAFQETYLAVDLFFILSGVVIANAYEERLLSDLSVAQFFWMRLVRIYPLYILGCFIAGLSWVVGGKSEEGNTLAIIFFALWLLPNLSSFKSFPLNGPAWSLLSELLANFFYSCIVRKLNSKLLVFIMLISGAGIAWILCFNKNLDIGFYTEDIPLGFFRVGYSFFAGVLIYRIFCAASFVHNIRFIGMGIVPWLMLLFLFLVLTASPSGLKHTIYDFLVVTAVFPAVIFVSLIFNPGSESAAFFKFLGLISYPIYVIHAPLSKWIPIIFKNSTVDLSTHPLWIGLEFVAILLPLCWFLDKFYDLPIRRIGLKIAFSFLKKRGSSELSALNKS